MSDYGKSLTWTPQSVVAQHRRSWHLIWGASWGGRSRAQPPAICKSIIALGYEWRQIGSERGRDGVAIAHMPSWTGQKTLLCKESEKEVAVSCWSALECCQNKAAPRCPLSSKPRPNLSNPRKPSSFQSLKHWWKKWVLLQDKQRPDGEAREDSQRCMGVSSWKGRFSS